MKKGTKRIAFLISGFSVMLASLATVTYAWFSLANEAALTSGQGYTASAYFAGGDGSEENPYLLDRPIHLYNLAWLQYLGLFNKNDGTAYQQKYFALSGDLDMTGWTLPPIGTAAEPFIGNFTGSYSGVTHSISNLTVSNVFGDSDINRKPTTVDAATFGGVDIVGVFGVVGQYNGALTYSWATSVNTISDLYLDSISVKSQTANTLIGVAVGYLNAAIANVGVSSSSITIASGTQPLASGPTTNFSDYSTIGYTPNDYRTSKNKATVSVKTPSVSSGEHFTYAGSGDAADWGGSIGMADLYTRLNAIFTLAKSTPLSIAGQVASTTSCTISGISTTGTLSYTGGFYQYYDDASVATKLKGSYSFSRYDSSDTYDDYIYLYGSTTLKKATINTTPTSIKYGSYYLIPSGTSLSATTSAASANVWAFSNFGGSGYLFTYTNNRVYYLNATTSSISLGTTPTTSWLSSGTTLLFVSRSTGYYPYYSTSASVWRVSSTSRTFTIPAPTTTTAWSDLPSTYTTKDTYFPINANTDYTPKSGNTGYIVGGASYQSGAFPYKSGDIRVSRYNITDLVASQGATATSSFSDSTTEILTKNRFTSGNYVVISDSHNNGQTSNVNSALSSYMNSQMTVSSLGYQKYDTSRAELQKTLSKTTDGDGDGNTDVYGFHFMEAAISKTNLATAEYAKVKVAGATGVYATEAYHSGFNMPRDSIDFNLQKKGYINFFAGTYFSGNDSFFSLHQIVRNSDLSINDIKEITDIYGKDGLPQAAFLYKYSDGSFSNSSYGTGTTNAQLAVDGYTPYFDTTWIKKQTNLVNNALYYFEIPANPGEYALGSVSQGTGAYLLYLDISANAQEIDRTIVLEEITEKTETFQFPNGIAIVMSAASGVGRESVNPLASAAIALTSTFTGTIAVSKPSSATILFDAASQGAVPVFKGDSLALEKSGSVDPPNVRALSSVETLTKRLTYIDYNVTEETTTSTVFSASIITTTDANGAVTTTTSNSNTFTKVDALGATTSGTATTYIDATTGKDVDISTNGTPTIGVLSSDVILSYWYSFDAAASTISVTFTLGHTKNTAVTGYTYHRFTGYTISLQSSTDVLSVTISAIDTASGSYVITFSTPGGFSQSVTVAGTVVSIPVSA